MNLKFEFSTIGDVFEQSFKLVVLAAAVALVNYFIGDESGIVAILSVGVFLISQFIRLLGLVSRYQVAKEDLQSALPSLELGREEIETVAGLADYIDESLDSIEEKYKADLESQINNQVNKNIDFQADIKQLKQDIAEKEREIEDAKRALNQSWSDKTKAVEEGRGEVQRLKEDLESEREAAKKTYQTNLMQAKMVVEMSEQLKEFEVFLSGDNEAIKAKYLSIVNRNNAKKKELVDVS